jgi:hypothetical protein
MRQPEAVVVYMGVYTSGGGARKGFFISVAIFFAASGVACA